MRFATGPTTSNFRLEGELRDRPFPEPCVWDYYYRVGAKNSRGTSCSPVLRHT